MTAASRNKYSETEKLIRIHGPPQVVCNCSGSPQPFFFLHDLFLFRIFNRIALANNKDGMTLDRTPINFFKQNLAFYILDLERLIPVIKRLSLNLLIPDCLSFKCSLEWTCLGGSV